MTVTVEDLLDQLAEDESRKEQLQMYLKTSKLWVQNAVTSSESDSKFFEEDKIQPLVDLAILSNAMDLWTHRGGAVTGSSAVRHIIAQLRGLYSSWEEKQDGEELQT